MAYTVERRIRAGLPQVGYAPYHQVHAHSTGNRKSTAQNEVDYFHRKDINSGFYTHLVGNGRVIQVAETGRGAWDVGGAWNSEGFASVELIESHATKEEFLKDYFIYCELLRDLAKQAGIPVTVDTDALEGIKTHNYCTYHQPANGSDHTDPLPYLTKWGITMEQFRKDVAGATGSGNSNTNNSNNNQKEESKKVQKMILITVTDKTTKLDGSQWLFNGEQLTRLDGISSEYLTPSVIKRDANGAQMRSLKAIGIRVVGAGL